MLPLTLTLVFLCAGALSSPTLYKIEDAKQLFEQFIQEYDRQYASDEEKQTRFEIFKQSLQTINGKNLRSDHAFYGINQFADVSREEFSTLSSCFKINTMWNHASCENITKVNGADAPDSFDWRDNNAVTRVKDQAGCGACWAFTTIGNVEGQYAIKYKELVEFSEQQLVDCDKTDMGCGGGNMILASRWLIENGGSMTAADYPYEAKKLQCRSDPSKIKAKIIGCKQFFELNEEDLLKLLHSQGPLIIGIDGSDLQFYEGGIIPNCHYDGPSHAVLLVGYGTESVLPYWIIKNSWGASWGEKGYFRIKRGTNGCGLLDYLIATVVVE